MGRRALVIGGREGFTLVELVVVLVFLGLAAAVAVPAFRPASERGAGPAARELARAWSAARGQAARRGSPVTVDLDLGTGSYAALAEGDSMRLDTLEAGYLPLSPGVRLSGGDGVRARAVFDALGRARADRVRITGEGEAHEVWADVWTGAARTR